MTGGGTHREPLAQRYSCALPIARKLLQRFPKPLRALQYDIRPGILCGGSRVFREFSGRGFVGGWRRLERGTVEPHEIP